MPTIRITILLISTYMVSPILYADKVYKTIDNNGNISYSSTPPVSKQTLKTITIPAPPSEQDINAAKQRHQQNLRTEKIYSESREQREQKIAEDVRIRKEKQALYTPPPELEEPKNKGPYYGIPGHGILVLPKGPRIKR